MQAELDENRQKIDVDTYTITVRELLSMVERRELHRAPAYQRRFRWAQDAESRLVESILLGLPVPNIFVATNEDGSWEVVDGLQRLSTLIHFMSESPEDIKELGKSGPLQLSGLRKLSSFNGLTFQELPVSIRLALQKRGLGITSLSDKSDPESRFETFERLNRGSLSLSPQEIRACVFQGPFNNLIRELAAHEGFRALIKLREVDTNAATAEELVLKFFAYRHSRANFKGAVDSFLTHFMESKRFEFDVEKGRQEFHSVVNAMHEVGPVPFLRKSTNVTPQNLLEAVMVAIAEIQEEGKKVGPLSPSWVDDPDLIAASTGATNTRKKLDERIKRARLLLGG